MSHAPYLLKTKKYVVIFKVFGDDCTTLNPSSISLYPFCCYYFFKIFYDAQYAVLEQFQKIASFPDCVVVIIIIIIIIRKRNTTPTSATTATSTTTTTLVLTHNTQK